MAARLPYLTTPGTLPNALDRLKAAATPPNVNADFIQTKLKIKGGAGRAIPPYLKKIGFVAGDGKPTSIYTRFRNSNSKTSGTAAADALKHGYRLLYELNEYAHELNDKDLNQDFHFGPGTVKAYTRAAPNTTSFRAEPCT